MKKLMIISLSMISMIACQEKGQKKADSTISISKDSEKIVKADIDFSSNPLANQYKTVITEKYNTLEVNFASYYVLITWGCGSGCVTGALVDIRDGKVYSTPEDKDWGGNGTYIESKKESEILETVAITPASKDEIEKTIKYWEWNENSKSFTFLEQKSTLVKE